MHQPWEGCDGLKKGTVSQGSMAGCYSLVGREQHSVPGACTWFPAVATVRARRIGKEQLGTSSKGGAQKQSRLPCMGVAGWHLPLQTPGHQSCLSTGCISTGVSPVGLGPLP